MFLEVVRTEGLGHLSYVIGDEGRAAVIDPRRDCKIYVDIAKRYDSAITHIFETHRYEDLILGSLELARRTKARILHGRALNFKFGEKVKEGDAFELGNLVLKILETPGHTPEGISIIAIDKRFSDTPFAIFTGDTLLYGRTGRTDLYPAKQKEMAGKLYDSIHNKIKPLGEHVVLYPAHGHSALRFPKTINREVSTLGYEFRINPSLKKNRKDFIGEKLAEEQYYAPCFRRIERFNQDGIQLVPKIHEPEPADVKKFMHAVNEHNMIVLDVRNPENFSSAHVKGSLNIPLKILPHYAGWFLPEDRKIGLVASSYPDIEEAQKHLMRIGLENQLLYFMVGDTSAWTSEGMEFDSIPVISLEELKQRINEKEETYLLDVRSRTEEAEVPISSSRRVWIGCLPEQTANLPKDRKIITICSGGNCAMLGASYLKQYKNGFGSIEVCLMAAEKYSGFSTPHLYRKQEKAFGIRGKP